MKNVVLRCYAAAIFWGEVEELSATPLYEVVQDFKNLQNIFIVEERLRDINSGSFQRTLQIAHLQTLLE